MKTLSFPELLEGLPFKVLARDDDNVSEHRHSFFEFAYVSSGRAEHLFEGNTAIVEAGDYFLVNLNSTHAFQRISNDGDFRIINCIFLPQFIDQSLSDAKSFRDILDNYMARYGYDRYAEPFTRRIFHDDSGIVGTLCEQILLEYNEKKTGYVDICRNLLLTLILYLVRNEALPLTHTAGSTVRQIKEYVDGHYMESLRLSDICHHLNFSLSYISSLFKQETGMTFRDYLIKIRIERSCRLLRVSRMTIEEIAGHVGYSDPAFFYKSFRRKMGTTPDDYRRQYAAKP